MTHCSLSGFASWRVLMVLLLAVPLITSGVGAEGQATRVPHAPSRFTEPAPMVFDNHNGFEHIFDGKNLADWEGDPSVWKVENGAIVGESTREHPVTNTYIWRKGLAIKDFDLRLEIKC